MAAVNPLPPTRTPAPASAAASPKASLLSQEAAVQIALDVCGRSDVPSIKVGFSRLTTWAAVPALGPPSDRAPSPGDHPVWFAGLGVGAAPAGGASLLVVIDAIDGHVIETQQAIS